MSSSAALPVWCLPDENLIPPKTGQRRACNRTEFRVKLPLCGKKWTTRCRLIIGDRLGTLSRKTRQKTKNRNNETTQRKYDNENNTHPRLTIARNYRSAPAGRIR